VPGEHRLRLYEKDIPVSRELRRDRHPADPAADD